MKNTLIIFIYISLVFTSCSWDDEADTTPQLLVAGSDFAFEEPFQVSRKQADFTNDSVTFVAKFNQKVSWKIRVEGITSGAVREFSGESDNLQEVGAWSGETNGDITQPVLFLEEQCLVSLDILGLNKPLLDTVEITKGKEYGILFSDFENAATALASPWFAPSTVDAQDMIAATIDSSTAMQGKKSLWVQGDDASNNYYIGNIGYNNIGAMKTGTKDASELYFNVYVFGSGAASATKLEVQFSEGDLEKWHYEISTTHVGWKYFAIPYSDFVKTEISKFGNELQDPHNIRLITFLLSSVPSGQQVETKIDYPILTVGKPLFR